MNNIIILLGLVLLFLGVILIFFGSASQASKAAETKTEAAGIVMIGPIPIMFGNQKLLMPLAILAIVLMAAWFLMFSSR